MGAGVELIAKLRGSCAGVLELLWWVPTQGGFPWAGFCLSWKVRTVDSGSWWSQALQWQLQGRRLPAFSSSQYSWCSRCSRYSWLPGLVAPLPISVPSWCFCFSVLKPSAPLLSQLFWLPHQDTSRWFGGLFNKKNLSISRGKKIWKTECMNLI